MNVRLSPRTARLALAALASAVVVAAAGPASAVTRKSVPETVSFKVGKTLVKDNTPKEDGGPLGTLFFGPQHSLVFRGVNVKHGKKGLVVTKTLDVFVQNIPDVRTAQLPITFAAGGGLGGSFQTDTTSDAAPTPVTLRWNVDPAGALPFTVKLLKYDSVTQRLVGSFGGTMRGAELTQKVAKVTAGKFVIDMLVEDMTPAKR